jgi:hypothetical protein
VGGTQRVSLVISARAPELSSAANWEGGDGGWCASLNSSGALWCSGLSPAYIFITACATNSGGSICIIVLYQFTRHYFCARRRRLCGLATRTLAARINYNLPGAK